MTPVDIIFNDYPDFKPNLTPQDIFELGSFGGTYWRPIESKFYKNILKNQHIEFKFLNNINDKYLTSTECNKKLNKYKVSSGSSLKEWEGKEWINKKDPYGWVQWYCRFYSGRRSDDDVRQINRWIRFTGPNGRFKKRLINMINEKKTTYDDFSVSPVIRQGLQQWAYQLTNDDII